MQKKSHKSFQEPVCGAQDKHETSLHLAEILGKTALGCLLVKRRKVMACLLHDIHHLVKRDPVRAVGEGREHIGVKRTCCRKGIAFDARYLHHAANRVTGHTEVMLQTHLRRILYLCRRTAEQLADSSGSHGARHTDLALAAHLSTAYGGVVLHHIAEKSCCCYGTEDACLTEILALPQW